VRGGWLFGHVSPAIVDSGCLAYLLDVDWLLIYEARVFILLFVQRFLLTICKPCPRLPVLHLERIISNTAGQRGNGRLDQHFHRKHQDSTGSVQDKYRISTALP